jgi:hypothetical protein
MTGKYILYQPSIVDDPIPVNQAIPEIQKGLKLVKQLFCNNAGFISLDNRINVTAYWYAFV